MDDYQSDAQIAWSKLIRYEQENPDLILGIDERLDFYVEAIELSSKLYGGTLFQAAMGFNPELNYFMRKSIDVPSALFYTYVVNEYNFTYSQSVANCFNSARLHITRFFIDNYKELERVELHTQLIEMNRDKQFFNVLSENENIKLYPDFIFNALSNSLLAQLYVLTDDMPNALSSLMNASYFYGVTLERSSNIIADIGEDRIRELINTDITKRAQKANEARWQGHVEQIRRKYLELDEIRQGKAEKKPTIKSVAEWICAHHNDQNLELETIRDHLSKARRGIFTNA